MLIIKSGVRVVNVTFEQFVMLSIDYASCGLSIVFETNSNFTWYDYATTRDLEKMRNAIKKDAPVLVYVTVQNVCVDEHGNTGDDHILYIVTF